HAPGPYAKAPEPYKDITPMDMLTFPNSRDFGLPAFVPNNVAACAVIHWDILKAFDNCAPTFDKLFGENETGIWEDVLESLEKDEDGPQINLRNELIALLEPHVTAVTSYQPEITATSERLLFLVRIKPGNEEKVIAGLRKWLREDDPTIRRRQFEGLDIWESVEPKSPKASAAPTITLPVYTPDKTADTPRKEHRLRRGDDEEQALLPHRSVAVFQGHLLIASHYDYLTEVLTQAKTPDPVSESMDFRLVGARMEAIGADEGCLRSFSRTDEEFRPTYELIRMGKMPEAETMFARMLNAAMGPAKRGKVRKQQIEGKEMPDFQVVRRALGPGGTFGKTEKDGWFVVGFVLEK
ncbi:MAG TPA: hypothetical protein VJL29_08495, partial [Thermoguttaceae bacterium]|nr:hypothetical protein [Thermoguttaceae bacterium]